MRNVFGVLIAALLAVSCLPESPANDGATERLTIVSKEGRHVFRVEIANTPEEQARGLMFRRELAHDAGMLFVYPGAGPLTMWMKNTFLPLDMLFIDDAGRISHIVERTVPMSTEIIRSNGPARAVLEVNGGTVSRLGIAQGDHIISPLLTPR